MLRRITPTPQPYGLPTRSPYFISIPAEMPRPPLVDMSHSVSTPHQGHTNHPTEKPKHPEFPFHARWLLVGLPTSIFFTLPVNLSFGTKKNNPQTPNVNQPAEMQPLVETPSVTENVVYDYYYYIMNGGSSTQTTSGGSSTETTVPIPTQTTTSTTTTGSSTGTITQSSSSNTTPNMYGYIYHGPVTPISSPIINSPISSPGSPISSSPSPIINLPPITTSPPSNTQSSSGSTPPTTTYTPVGVEQTPSISHPSTETPVFTPSTTRTVSSSAVVPNQPPGSYEMSTESVVVL